MSAPFRIASVKRTKSTDEEPAAIAVQISGARGGVRPGQMGLGTGRGRGDLQMLQRALSTGKKKKAAAPGKPEKADPLKSYLDRLVKLIPAEVVSIYLVGIGVIPANGKGVMVAWAVFCLFVVILARAYTTSDKKHGIPVEWPAVAISVGAYIIWVYVSPGPFTAYGLAIPYIGSLLILGWTTIVPYLYNPK